MPQRRMKQRMSQEMIPRYEREYQLCDLLSSLKYLISGLREPHSGFSRLFPSSSIYFVRSGREALYVLLRSIGLRRGARVGVPMYCCMAVFEAIVAAGHIPVFLDLDVTTYGIDLVSLSRAGTILDALIIVHTFGYPVDNAVVKACLGGRQIPIIEDCAHSLFSECRGVLTGGLTEASFFSFGAHKPAAIGGGAALVVNDPALDKRVDAECRTLGEEPRSREIAQVLRSWLRSVAYRRSVYGALMASPLKRMRDGDRGDPEVSAWRARAESWQACHMRRVDLAQVANRVQSFRGKTARLAANAQWLRRATEQSPLEIPEEPSWGQWNHFMLPFRYETREQCDRSRGVLRRRGIDSAVPYAQCLRNAGFFGYKSGCPHAEKWAGAVSMLPNYASLSDGDIEYIGKCLRESVA